MSACYRCDQCGRVEPSRGPTWLEVRVIGPLTMGDRDTLHACSWLCLVELAKAQTRRDNRSKD